MYSGRPWLLTRICSVLPATIAEAVRTVADAVFVEVALVAWSVWSRWRRRL
jgi:hypothetical protein